jgi:dephospho-CoA kinase
VVYLIKIGLTGGIGSGKSTVSQMMRDENIKVIEADIISREVIIKYPEITIKIREHFGDTYFDTMGILNRRKLGDYVFKNKKERFLLEEIIIPYIIKDIWYTFDKLALEGHKLVVLDAPTLIEQGLDKKMDINLLVWVNETTQKNRLINRDILSEEQALDRIKAQMPIDEKKKYVDYVIDNTGTLASTKMQLLHILNKIESMELQNENKK